MKSAFPINGFAMDPKSGVTVDSLPTVRMVRMRFWITVVNMKNTKMSFNVKITQKENVLISLINILQISVTFIIKMKIKV